MSDPKITPEREKTLEDSLQGARSSNGLVSEEEVYANHYAAWEKEDEEEEEKQEE